MSPERKRMFRILDFWFKYYRAIKYLTIYIFVSVLSLKLILSLNDVYDKYINFVTFGLMSYLYVGVVSIVTIILIISVYNSWLRYQYIIHLKQDNLRTSRNMVIEIRHAAEELHEKISLVQGYNLKREA